MDWVGAVNERGGGEGMIALGSLVRVRAKP